MVSGGVVRGGSPGSHGDVAMRGRGAAAQQQRHDERCWTVCPKARAVVRLKVADRREHDSLPSRSARRSGWTGLSATLRASTGRLDAGRGCQEELSAANSS
mmetsp:Transcript_105864/g.338073  ORF Transcript_105864/g.338073 Transcript_105864/m.338073 type:complete len:101 (-) Transcript_105864:221-523(-)